MNTLSSRVDKLRDVACILEREDIYLDYHGGNYMLDSSGCVVSTDPLCYVHGYHEC